MVFRDFKREADELQPSIEGAVILLVGAVFFLTILIYHGIDLTIHFTKMRSTPRIMFCVLVLIEFIGMISSGYGARWHLRGLRKKTD